MAVYLYLKRSPTFPSVLHFSSKFSLESEYKKFYRILGVNESSDQEEIRLAYLELVKQYHPDSGTEKANAEKFQEIDKAFRALIRKKSKEHWDVQEAVLVEEQDIKHTAPQHRQYLSYDGVGSGNPFQRQKQYEKIRAAEAVENVYQHRVAKVTASENALMEKVPVKHKIKTKNGFDRLVEDLIQESISKGEFNNLSGSGKPLKNTQNLNPFVDFVTQKLNEILIDNGFTPEWITLHKEIRQEAQLLRKSLFIERQHFGPYPLTVEDNIEWSECVYKYSTMVQLINKKIAKFNLVVPILEKQMLMVSLEKEAQRAMVLGKSNEGANERKKQICNKSNETINFVSLIFDFFKRK